ncbi:DUF6192 family protein [Amycolatopsis echigonensis]|uniref:Uncharacterized protein n=1 Tax=Amycolatopsis echigonensis TaxID=2576905 RepID=A0A2N3X0F8_9PSEU|nr:MULTISPECIES: DUF6192 family protein [Amycolatopsis]MBB2501179.1 hypothetical protein [Amycolatopsis echigonensis]PKV99600.1 hypothetical protein ATK30_0580 [Amycolatopsis niigatensis]
MTRPDMFTARQWDRWVKRGRTLVRSKTNIQFELGEITLDMIPKQRNGFEDHGVEAVLRAYAAAIGLSTNTLKSYRHVAIAWPAEKRNPDVSFTIHDILSAHPSRFRKIGKPPLDPVSGERRWTVNEALRAAGRTPQHPVTPQERVDRVRDLVRDDEDAALAVKDILKRPTVVRHVLNDPSARHILRQADRPRYYVADEDDEDNEPDVGYDEPESAPPPPRRTSQVHYSEAPREVLELLGACTTFYTQMQRMIPTLHVAEYDKNTKHTLLESIERVRAAAGWAETVINTGDTSMDEALAKMLGGES